MKTIHKLIMTFFITAMLSGCGGIIIAGAASGAVVASDRRDAGVILGDEKIELKVIQILTTDNTLSRNTHVSPISYNNILLLVGQVPNNKVRNTIVQRASEIEGVRRIHDEMTIAEPLSFGDRSKDSWITVKTKSTLISAKGFDAGRVKVITEDGVVFLMGIISREDGDAIAKLIQQVSGVKKIIKVFEYERP